MATDGMLAKGLNLLEALGDHPNGVGVSQLAREIGLPISTAHRLLATMVALGFVRFDAEYRRYYLGLKVFELSHQVSLTKRLSEVALPVMKRVADIAKESVSLAVRDGKELVYIEWAEGRNRIQVSGAVGTRGPLYSTSQGKVLLAILPQKERDEIIDEIRLEPRGPNTITNPAVLRRELERTRERGYAVADEENEEKIRAIAVPVMSIRGEPIAAISVVAPTFRVPQEDLEKFAPLLHEAAREIGLQLQRGANLPVLA